MSVTLQEPTSSASLPSTSTGLHYSLLSLLSGGLSQSSAPGPAPVRPLAPDSTSSPWMLPEPSPSASPLRLPQEGSLSVHLCNDLAPRVTCPT